MHCHQAVRCPAIVAGQWPAPGHACPLWRQTAPVAGGRILVASTATARDWSSAPEPPTQHHTYRLGKAIGTNTARNTTSAQLGRPPQQSIPSCPGHPRIKPTAHQTQPTAIRLPGPYRAAIQNVTSSTADQKPDRRIGIRTDQWAFPDPEARMFPLCEGRSGGCRPQHPTAEPSVVLHCWHLLPIGLRPREQEGAKYSPDMHRDGVCDRRYPESAAHEELLAKERFAWVPSGITAPV
jgi:hypothetical protein